MESHDSSILTNRGNFEQIQIGYNLYIPVLVSHFFTNSLLTARLQCTPVSFQAISRHILLSLMTMEGTKVSTCHDSYEKCAVNLKG